MPADKEEFIGVRVPDTWKKAIQELAAQRFTSESAIAREAMLEYLVKRGITADQLRDKKGVKHPKLENPTQTRFPKHKETAHELNDPTHAPLTDKMRRVTRAATKMVKSKHSPSPSHEPKT